MFLSISPLTLTFLVFFFNDTATTEIYTLSLHDALPISMGRARVCESAGIRGALSNGDRAEREPTRHRSEEHTSELQSPCNLVCRLLLEKKKQTKAEQLHGGSDVSVSPQTQPSTSGPARC